MAVEQAGRGSEKKKKKKKNRGSWRKQHWRHRVRGRKRCVASRSARRLSRRRVEDVAQHGAFFVNRDVAASRRDAVVW